MGALVMRSVKVNFLTALLGAWLIVGGILFRAGDWQLTRTTLLILAPVTMIAFGVWMVVRARIFHGTQRTIPATQLVAEIAFCVFLLALYSLARYSPVSERGRSMIPSGLQGLSLRGTPGGRFYFPDTHAVRMGYTITSSQNTRPEHLPSGARTLFLERVGFEPVSLDISGAARFSWYPGRVRALALSSEIVRAEVMGQGPNVSVPLKVPSLCSLHILSHQGDLVAVRNMKGDVCVNWNGGSLWVSTEGNILVAHRGYSWMLAQTSNLLLHPGPESRVEVETINSRVTIEATEPPTKSWSIKVRSGHIFLRLPSNSSAKVVADVWHGTVSGPFQKMSRTDDYESYLATLTSGQVQIKLEVWHGSVTLAVR